MAWGAVLPDISECARYFGARLENEAGAGG